VAQVYLAASRYSTSVFRCEELENGQRVLAAYPGIVCDSPEHSIYFGFGVVGIIVYMVGYPLLVGLLLWRIQKKKLRTDTGSIASLGWVCSAIRLYAERMNCPFRSHLCRASGVRFFRGRVVLLRSTHHPPVKPLCLGCEHT
jgi:hypothetical protein